MKPPGMPWTSTAEFVAYKFRWLKQVIQRHRRLHKVALTVAVGLVDFFNYDSGEAFPKNVTLGKAVNLSERSVAAGMKGLRDDDHLLQVGWRGYRNRVPSLVMQFRGVVTEETCAESGTQYAGLKPAESGTLSPLNPAHCMRTEHVPTEHVYFPPSPKQEAARARAYDAEADAVEVQQERRPANEERKRIALTATVERSPPSAPKRSEHGTRALADLADRKGRPVPPPPPEMKPEPDVQTITADQVAAVITSKPIPPTAIDVTPREAPMLTPVAGEPVSSEMDECLQFASEWGGIKLDRAVEVVTAMIAKLPIERVRHHFSKVSKLHRSGRQKLALVEQAITEELSDLHPVQPDLFAPSPCVMALGATSPPCGAAPPPQALVFDLAALRQYAAQIAAWQPQLDAATAQRKAKEWMAAGGAKRLALLFATVAPRKRSGAFKFEWIEERVANPRPPRPARRQARGSGS